MGRVTRAEVRGKRYEGRGMREAVRGKRYDERCTRKEVQERGTRKRYEGKRGKSFEAKRDEYRGT